MRPLAALAALFLLSGCFGWWPGGSSDPSPTIAVIDEAIEDMMKEEAEEEVQPEEDSGMGNPEEETEEMTTPPRRPDPIETPEEEVEEEKEPEVVPPPPPPPPPMKTEFDYWEDDQAEFLNVRTTFPSSITIDSYEHTADMMPPSASATYEGDIDGEMNPTRDYLSDPRIKLTYTFADRPSIRAEISYEHEGNRSVMERYGASVESDGTFSSFDGLNPKGFDGGFYGNEAFVAGNVSTPRVHGTYVAQ